MEERWYFPPNLGGDEEGFNHAGMVHFKADPHRYTARETIQNVLDAKDPNKKGQPTVVKFRLFKVPTKDAIPELGIFKEIIKENIESNKGDSGAHNFFKRALKVANKNNIDILQISDYNTVGITGINERGGRWHNLIKKKGTSKAHGDIGGTYGIGKSAPFLCSELRTVFYNTINVENESAHIWKSIFTTHGDTTEKRADGYYCNVEKISDKHVNTLGIINNITQTFIDRTSKGTDLFILGFKKPNLTDEKGIYQPWNVIFRNHVMDNYFIAIYENELKVEFIDETKGLQHEINATNIYEEMKNQYATNKFNNFPFLDAYYDVEETNQFKKKIDGLGLCKLYIKTKAEYPKIISYMRKPHMLVYKDPNPNLERGYSALFICDNARGNKKLARMEGPTHGEWNAGYSVSIDESRKIKRRINSFINEKLRSLAIQTFSNQTVLEGLEQLIGYSDTSKKGNNKDENKHNNKRITSTFNLKKYRGSWEDINYTPPKHKKRKRRKQIESDEGYQPGEESDFGVGGQSTSTNKGGSAPGESGFGPLEGGSTGKKKYKRVPKSVYTCKCFYDINQNSYKLVINTKYERQSNIYLFARGLDNPRNEKIFLNSAIDNKSNEGYKITRNVINNVHITSEPKEILITIKNNRKYSIMVDLYE